ncbi:MAG: hypothetical protein RIK87_15435 [Fuerstiella sp.]
MNFKITGWAAVAGLSFFLAGCAEESTPKTPVLADAHDHEHGDHHHPETFAEAFEEVTGMRNTIRESFQLQDPEAAHEPLHEVGHLLETMSEMAAKSDLSEDAKALIETNIDVLFDAFGAVDKKMHDGETGKDYSEVSDAVDAALTAISDAAGPLAEHDGDHEEGDHDHGTHDHDGHDEKEDHHDHAEDDGDHHEEAGAKAESASEKQPE